MGLTTICSDLLFCRFDCLEMGLKLMRFSPLPPRPFTPAGERSAARLFFGYFLLAKQKKVARPAGRNSGLRPHKTT